NALGNSIYGCDRCQNACPWNRFACATEEERFLPSKELLEMKRDDWNNLTVEDYRVLFKGSAVKRAKYEGLMRNISIAKENNR
ncbi:MAG: tRNA epoxyqueuosine(34) reductase QueG, partial [Prevotella sp.]|nr:tRNA epoxyqueuosine(34) reductase QueG [Prevotella sp.]